MPPANPGRFIRHQVRTPFLLPDGGVGVPLASDATIRLFDVSGTFVRSIGSMGEGPGEFASIATAWAHGDTVGVFDDRLQRVTRFPGMGAPEIVTLEGRPAQFALEGWSGDGWVLGGFEPGPPRGRGSVGVRYHSPDGGLLDRIGELPDRRRYEIPGATVPDPLAPRAIVRAHGTRVYLGETSTPEITVVDVASGARHRFSWEVEPADPVNAAGLLRDTLRVVLAEHEWSWVETALDVRDPDDSMSVFWDFLVDEEGFIWVRPFELMEHAVHLARREGPGAGGEWLVFSPEGDRVGTMKVPGEIEPVRITTDAVVGIRRDELGVESVRVHRLERVHQFIDGPEGLHTELEPAAVAEVCHPSPERPRTLPSRK